MKKKRCKVVRLPTDKAQDSIVDCSNRLQYFKGFFTQEYLKSQGKSSHHLYITSDDKIEAGDWCLFFWDGNKEGELGQIGSEPQQYFPENGHTLNKNLRKIIATTNPKLHSTRLKDCPINPEDNMVSVRGVSKPSQSFIEEYCRKGGIDEVDVEYEDKQQFESQEDYDYNFHLILKTDSHNIITIHPIKDTYTRDEVINQLKAFDEWFNENWYPKGYSHLAIEAYLKSL